MTYTPTGGFSGPDSFTYKVNDGTTDSTAKTATLTVNAPARRHVHLHRHRGRPRQVDVADHELRRAHHVAAPRGAAGGTLPTYRDYLKFNVTGMTGTVASVKLRLWITDVSTDSGRSSGRRRPGVRHRSPGAGPMPHRPSGARSVRPARRRWPAAWIEITFVGSPVNGNVGNVAFALKTTSTNSSIFDSSEGAHPPELVVTTN